MDKLTITSSSCTGIVLAVSDYATLSDDDRAVDGLLRTAVLGLEIFGVVDTLLSEELDGNFLLESYTM